ncbi:GTD2B protein, partial [Atractosteus spatula]|nr:GTD2B protein [Atractosteus spatula]
IEDSIRASFIISEMIAKSPRLFTEGQFIKDCFIKASNIFCPNRKKVFEGRHLSANTVASRITELGNNVHKETTSERHGTVCFKNWKYALKTQVSGNGAPAMSSENVVVVGLLKAKLNNLGVSGTFTAIHCILHQEVLCGKSLKMKEVMDVVVKTINFICSRSLNHRQFSYFLSSIDSKYGELLYHTKVRWLSQGNVLKRFFALREEIALFMSMKNKDVPRLADPTFISHFAFLTDITEDLNALSLKLQGTKQVITQMYDSVKSFKCKLSSWAKQRTDGNLAHFSALQSLGMVEPHCLKEYTDVTNNLRKEFDRRFKEFKVLEPQLKVFATPFAVEVDSVSEEFQMDIVELQCDTILKQKYMDVGDPDFYKFLSQEGFRG